MYFWYNIRVSSRIFIKGGLMNGANMTIAELAGGGGGGRTILMLKCFFINKEYYGAHRLS